jgi:hypothetical protein
MSGQSWERGPGEPQKQGREKDGQPRFMMEPNRKASGPTDHPQSAAQNQHELDFADIAIMLVGLWWDGSLRAVIQQHDG